MFHSFDGWPRRFSGTRVQPIKTPRAAKQAVEKIECSSLALTAKLSTSVPKFYQTDT